MDCKSNFLFLYLQVPELLLLRSTQSTKDTKFICIPKKHIFVQFIYFRPPTSKKLFCADFSIDLLKNAPLFGLFGKYSIFFFKYSHCEWKFVEYSTFNFGE